MSISIQTLKDVLVALVTTVGLAVAVSIAIMAAGAVFKRDQARVAKAAAQWPGRLSTRCRPTRLTSPYCDNSQLPAGRKRDDDARRRRPSSYV